MDGAPQQVAPGRGKVAVLYIGVAVAGLWLASVIAGVLGSGIPGVESHVNWPAWYTMTNLGLMIAVPLGAVLGVRTIFLRPVPVRDAEGGEER